MRNLPRISDNDCNLKSLGNSNLCTLPKSFFFLRCYLLTWERQRASTHMHMSWGWVGEKQTTCWAGCPTQDSISRPQDHDLSQRQILNQLSHQAPLCTPNLKSQDNIKFYLNLNILSKSKILSFQIHSVFRWEDLIEK